MTSDKCKIPILIPAYEPDERLIDLLKTLELNNEFLIVVDDGSGDSYQSIFECVEQMLGENGVVLHHDKNRGKGRALKTGFGYILDHMPQAVGTVTADSDGQHDRASIDLIKNAMLQKENDLILGVRSFDGEDIPLKSRIGNKMTIKVMSYISGVCVSDTQTGLRGIPRDFMQELLTVKGERFEFETEMLVRTSGNYHITEVSIATIYDSKENHQTHFRAVRDSLKIYAIFGKQFLKFMISSLSSTVLDVLLFSLFLHLVLRGQDEWIAVPVATAMARVISAIYNYLINYTIVFKSKASASASFIKYVCLALCQMFLSAAFTTLGAKAFLLIPREIIKIVVDTTLFFISYKLQQKLVFKK